ncbi:MAG TPA: hydroxymethylbilane synthase [Steroidobacteraceae bacterium]|jgi:hydroxymethylbilane synthase|nr:hydroxymethylbilane synthase [Steroidobacteraceae bacterium]
MSARTLRIGTRASALALWQANRVAQLIRAQPGAPAVELVHIKTEGDVRTDVPLWAVGGRAFFTREIDRAQLAGEVDLAVHSLKDLSTLIAEGLDLAAVLEREDPRDALLTHQGASLQDLPPGARVGTSSLRRRAFLLRARPDLSLLELRGNVPTRIERLAEGKYDAIVLATAGLKRLNLSAHIAAHIEPAVMPPAVSQGAIGVCARAGDESALQWLRALDHRATRLAVTAERALLRRIEGGCQVPLGALATLEGTRLTLAASVCALDGSVSMDCRDEAPAADAVTLGIRVAEQLLARGAGSIIAQQRNPSSAELP